MDLHSCQLRHFGAAWWRIRARARAGVGRHEILASALWDCSCPRKWCMRPKSTLVTGPPECRVAVKEGGRLAIPSRCEVRSEGERKVAAGHIAAAVRPHEDRTAPAGQTPASKSWQSLGVPRGLTAGQQLCPSLPECCQMVSQTVSSGLHVGSGLLQRKITFRPRRSWRPRPPRPQSGCRTASSPP
jgi:hypothetical protein